MRMLTIELQTVFRQTDRAFVDMLNAVRDGNIDDTLLRKLNGRYRPGFDPADEEGYIRLTTHNARAAAVNEGKLASLAGQPTVFRARIRPTRR